MDLQSIEPWEHDHVFGQDRARAGERRTAIVSFITAVTMVVEIVAGILFGSMALLADGLHMASHTVALAVAVLAYRYTRRHARNESFSFGTGKVNSLAGYSGAIILGFFAILMASESVERLISPVHIVFDQAILVAFVGLVVNGASIMILGGHHPSAGDGRATDRPGGARNTAGIKDHGEDHNLRSAYLHVLADALTSVLAIVSLMSGKYLAQTWMDPATGIVGAVMVARWSLGLLRASGRVLLDFQAPEEIRRAIRERLESDGESRVGDLHVWSIGPGIYAAEICIVTEKPKSAAHYKALLPADLGLVHVTVEVNGVGRPSR